MFHAGLPRPAFVRKALFRRLPNLPRFLLTLAIETSCDDTSVAVLETQNGRQNTVQDPTARAATLHYHQKVTSDNREHRGIHPIVSLESHRANLANLVNDALRSLPSSVDCTHDTPNAIGVIQSGDEVSWKKKPDFISVTRGPGMHSNLAVGLDTAKGLAVAWQVPIVGVHHMQAHALTPRLVSALEQGPGALRSPDVPFLSLLISGGHTMLLNSTSLTDHSIIASTVDVAVGDSLDKTARMILPSDWLARSTNTMYGRLLEQFAFPNGAKDYDYCAPARRGDEMNQNNFLGEKLMLPFTGTRDLKYSFAGITSTVERAFARTLPEKVTQEERVELARLILRIFFEHLASRVVIALQDRITLRDVKTLVISGGVASNNYLKHVLRSFLDIRGFSNIQITYPPPSLCTDNAAMIAWAGIEMFEAGWTTDLSVSSIRRWPMDSSTDGGILGASGWIRKKHLI